MSTINPIRVRFKKEHVNFKFIVQDGLVLHLDAGNDNSYPGSGTTWSDLSGQGNNGTLTNGPTFDSGNGGSIVFDGSNDFGRIDSFSSDSNSALSVFCWVYPKNLTTEQFGGNYLNWIINKRNTDSNNSNSWQMSVRNSYPTVTMWNNSNTAITPSSASQAVNSSLQLNRWYYVGFVTDGVNGGFLNTYINESLNFSGTLTGNRGIETKPIDIGKIGWGNAFYWNGNIAQVSIYNRALIASEVQQNYNALKGRFGL